MDMRIAGVVAAVQSQGRFSSFVCHYHHQEARYLYRSNAFWRSCYLEKLLIGMIEHESQMIFVGRFHMSAPQLSILSQTWRRLPSSRSPLVYALLVQFSNQSYYMVTGSGLRWCSRFADSSMYLTYRPATVKSHESYILACIDWFLHNFCNLWDPAGRRYSPQSVLMLL